MSFVLDDIVYLEDNENKICCVKYVEVNKPIIVIPAVANGFTVVGIYDNAFSFNAELKEITLPDTIRKIGAYAFTSCFNLKKVEFERSTLPASSKTNTLILGEKAFLCCYELETINFLHKRLYVKNQCFDGCMSLVDFVGVIVSAQTDSFVECRKLVSLTIANETHVDFLDMHHLSNLKHLYFGSQASLSETVVAELVNNNVIIHCPQISNMMDLLYLGCIIRSY